MANQAEPLAMGGFAEDAEADARFLAHKRYLAWRRRLLPLGAVILFLLIWWQAVVQFEIKPFIAPSPVAVAIVLVERFGILMTNLLPTAIEAVCGFLLGNIAAISFATVFVYRKTAEEALFPIAVGSRLAIRMPKRSTSTVATATGDGAMNGLISNCTTACHQSSRNRSTAPSGSRRRRQASQRLWARKRASASASSANPPIGSGSAWLAISRSPARGAGGRRAR